MPKKIVIVEDEPSLIKVLNLQLLSAGYEVFYAPNGKDGLQMIQEKKPDLVLLDLILPQLSGFEVLRLTKENLSTHLIPIIILSNLGQTEEVKRCIALGAEDYFIKSNTDLGAMVEKIESVLQK